MAEMMVGVGGGGGGEEGGGGVGGGTNVGSGRGDGGARFLALKKKQTTDNCQWRVSHPRFGTMSTDHMYTVIWFPTVLMKANFREGFPSSKNMKPL